MFRNSELAFFCILNICIWSRLILCSSEDESNKFVSKKNWGKNISNVNESCGILAWYFTKKNWNCLHENKSYKYITSCKCFNFSNEPFCFFLKKRASLYMSINDEIMLFLNTCQQQKRSYTTCHFSHENIFCVKQWHVCFIFLWIFKNTKDSNWETIFWTLCNSSETIKSFVDRAKKMNFQSSDVHPISDQVTFKANWTLKKSRVERFLVVNHAKVFTRLNAQKPTHQTCQNILLRSFFNIFKWNIFFYLFFTRKMWKQRADFSHKRNRVKA